MRSRLAQVALLVSSIVVPAFGAMAQPGAVQSRQVGYYRHPAIHDDLIVFVAEGDLWTVGIDGGIARRLTTDEGEELQPAISPDGRTIAFLAEYEGPREIYTMPLAGGAPVRRTFTGGDASVAGWTPDGDLVYVTRRYATLPNRNLVTLDLETGERHIAPLAQASAGVYDDDGTLYFVRLPWQGSDVKRYKGGTAQNLWKFRDGWDEAQPLTPDYAGTSRRPMLHGGRLFFVSDRDGTMNIWSMTTDGGDVMQHTRHAGWDVLRPSLHNGRITYQCGADLWIYDIEQDRARRLSVSLAGDYDRTHERWVENPMTYLTGFAIDPKGERAVLTSRGEVFVVSSRHGRIDRITDASGIRFRDARFAPDGASVIALSDETAELEYWRLPLAPGVERQAITADGTIFRFGGVVSPDGRHLAFQDKDRKLWLHDIETGTTSEIAQSPYDAFGRITFSPDSRFLTYVATASNTNTQIRLYDIETGAFHDVTSDRVSIASPAWTADGEWIYFISERYFNTLVRSPWGPHQPDPFFDRTMKLYCVSTIGDQRSPFEADDEIVLEQQAEDETAEEHADEESETAETEAAEEEEEEDEETGPAYDFAGITDRSIELPVEPGRYWGLTMGDGCIFFMDGDRLGSRTRDLRTLEISRDDPEVKTVASGVGGYDITPDGSKLLIRHGNQLSIVKAAPKADLDEGRLELGNWRFTIDPRAEWRQIFKEAWRYERDYFYDPDMHGVNWPAMLNKYLPLVERVTNRQELSDLMRQLVGEISALHTSVFGGDMQGSDANVNQGFLGARLRRDVAQGGYVIERIYTPDPNYPERRGPLDRPGLDVGEDDVITAVNHRPVLDARDIGLLLRDQVGRPVRLTIARDGDMTHDVIVTPIGQGQDRSLRYDEWEHTRRVMVDEMGDGEIGYLHLRAMSGGDMGRFVRQYYPVFDRKALIVDVRHNGGGNTDSWILGKLMREVWMYWQGRTGKPYGNMQYGFRGHMVLLCNEHTGSDGEAFAEGFRRLGLGRIIGTRTWGGEIWLSYSTPLVDRGMAAVAEDGVFGPEGEWLIEGHGVDPDIVVDNLPHATFLGRDAQLEAAVVHLRQRLEDEPIDDPVAPPYPDKSHRTNR
jgi:tricorn protease